MKLDKELEELMKGEIDEKKTWIAMTNLILKTKAGIFNSFVNTVR
jgi:hypothetical protein